MAECILSHRTKVKELTAEVLRSEFLYNAATGEFRRLKKRGGRDVGSVAGYINKSLGYVLIEVLGKTYFAHRLAWLYMHGEWPRYTIDHINRCKSDNRMVNLRDIEHCENGRNVGIRSNNTSGVTGVYWHKTTHQWMVLAYRYGKQISLGYFKSWFDAVRARKEWERLNPIQ
jgi:hypothetical protein